MKVTLFDSFQSEVHLLRLGRLLLALGEDGTWCRWSWSWAEGLYLSGDDLTRLSQI